MIPIRSRCIAACRKPHDCVDCGREICRGDPCVEISIYQPREVWSEYTCCRPSWSIQIVTPRLAFRDCE